MNRAAAPLHASVRFGPLADGAHMSAQWAGDVARGDWHHLAERALTGTVLAADTRDAPRLLAAADIITVFPGAGPGARGWLGRYPGCAVAVAAGLAATADLAGPAEYQVATRDGTRPIVTAGARCPAGALAVAVFAYCWLAAGWPVALLRPARLRVSLGAAWLVPGQPLFFRFRYCPVSGAGPSPGLPGAPDPARASRTGPASGAPSDS